MKSKKYILATLLISSFLLSGCGSGSDDSETQETSPSAQFLCKHTGVYEDSNADGVYDIHMKYQYDDTGNIEKLSTDLNNDGSVDNYIEYERSDSKLIGENKYLRYGSGKYELVSGKTIYHEQHGNKKIKKINTTNQIRVEIEDSNGLVYEYYENPKGKYPYTSFETLVILEKGSLGEISIMSKKVLRKQNLMIIVK